MDNKSKINNIQKLNMESKKEIIDYINITRGAKLSNANTSYSSINKSRDVWWFNIPTDKFKNDVYLLLNNGKKVIWIELHAGFVSDVRNTFKIRDDRDVVDLEISSDINYKYLIDIKSGGKGFDFSNYVKNTV